MMLFQAVGGAYLYWFSALFGVLSPTCRIAVRAGKERGVRVYELCIARKESTV